MSISSSVNNYIERVEKITICTSSKATDDEKKGFIFGGHGYSADVSANDGNGYEISIRVISRDGRYLISKNDLNPNKDGAKNISIGNFTFFDFYLISYEISKSVDSTILTLKYKDKSIFMDRLYIALLNNEFGPTLVYERDLPKRENLDGISSSNLKASFAYKCSENNIARNAYIERRVKSCFTRLDKKDDEINGINWTESKYKFLQSNKFYSKYDFNTNGPEGGFISVGVEQIDEQPCSIKEASYSFVDLTSALFHSNIPGIENFNLGDDRRINYISGDLFRNLRRQYSGTLRDVLDNWGNDFGFKFFYQPKIEFKIKDYSSTSGEVSTEIINEGIKYIDLNSSKTNISNIDSILNNEGLKRVIESYSESASLEGTRKSSVITPMKREARAFSSSDEQFFINSASMIPLSSLPAFLGLSPIDNKTIINGVLMQYDEELRDIYSLSVYGSSGPSYWGIASGNFVSLTNPDNVSFTDFKKIFGFDDPSGTINDYVIYLAYYDESKHKLIKEWEKKLMGEFYGQYFQINNLPNDITSCGSYNNFNIKYNTNPESKRYYGYEVPYKDLLLSQITSEALSTPIFNANNPYASENSLAFDAFKENLKSSFLKDKSLKIINLREDAEARNALLSCFPNYDSQINKSNVKSAYLIICPKLKNFNISLVNDANNTSIETIASLSSKLNPDTQACGKTICEENLFTALCDSSNNSGNTVNKAISAFLDNKSLKMTLSYGGQSCDLILPSYSNYQYVLNKNNSYTLTVPSANYVLGTPPIKEGNEKYLSSSVNINNPPEVLTQAYSESGIQDRVVGFSDTGSQTNVISLRDFHEKTSTQLNESILEPQVSKTISLISTYIPYQIKDFIFGSPVLNDINFSLDEGGVGMRLNFSSRPKFIKPKDTLFEVKKFIYTL